MELSYLKNLLASELCKCKCCAPVCWCSKWKAVMFLSGIGIFSLKINPPATSSFSCKWSKEIRSADKLAFQYIHVPVRSEKFLSLFSPLWLSEWVSEWESVCVRTCCPMAQLIPSSSQTSMEGQRTWSCRGRRMGRIESGKARPWEPRDATRRDICDWLRTVAEDAAEGTAVARETAERPQPTTNVPRWNNRFVAALVDNTQSYWRWEMRGKTWPLTFRAWANMIVDLLSLSELAIRLPETRLAKEKAGFWCAQWVMKRKRQRGAAQRTLSKRISVE